jgi:hypothetical protein
MAVIVVAAAVGITSMLTSDSDGDTPTTSFPQAVTELGAGDPHRAVDGRLELGPAEFVGESTVGPGGGEITASDGMRISIAAGAHDRDVLYRVERKLVNQSTFPDWIQPVSPLYLVDNGGATSLKPLTIEVPAAVPPGGFAMGLFYEEATGRIEAMPLIDVTERSVTVATAHFSSFVVVTLPGWGPGNPAVPNVDTGFRPGVDDWQFTNYGSYIAPDGHCGGQSISAMWHYIEKRLTGGAALYSTYDNNGAGATPTFWQDDSEGYRLASVVQQDLATGWGDAVLQGYLQYLSRNDLQYTAFMAAMAITGHPQFVGIWNSTTLVGHHMIVYGGDPTGLLVADPNYPGQLRRIPWDPATGQLGPYDSASNASGPGIAFDLIGYLGLDALVNWGAITDRWAALEAQAAGDGAFPDFTLLTLDPTTAAWNSLGSTVDLATERFTATAQMPGVPWRLTAYGPSGPVTGQQEQPVGVDLPPGTTEVGILVEAIPPGASFWTYVDYIDVVVTTGGIPPTAQQTTVTADPNLDPQMGMSVGPAFGWSDIEVGSTLALLVSVFNEGPGAVTNVEVTSSAPDCNRSLGSIPEHDDVEYICYIDVNQLGTQEHSVAVTAASATGVPLSDDSRFSFEGIEPYQIAENTISLKINPPIPRVAVGQAATFEATLTSHFPADWGTGDPLILEVFTSHHPWVGTPLYTVYPDPEGAPPGFAVTCTAPNLQYNGPSGSYLLELGGGSSATLTCTLPGVSVAGMGYYMFWAKTSSGYDVGNVHSPWIVEVYP